MKIESFEDQENYNYLTSMPWKNKILIASNISKNKY